MSLMGNDVFGNLKQRITFGSSLSASASIPVHVFAFVFRANRRCLSVEQQPTATQTLLDLCSVAQPDEKEAEKVPYLSRQIGIYQRSGEIEETGDPCS